MTPNGPFKQRSLREAAREGQAARQQEGAKPPPPPGDKAKPPPRQKVKPPVVGTEPVVVLCGHTIQFEHFPEKADKFRDRRREKAVARKCPECRQKDHLDRIARQKAEAEERRKLNPVRPGQRFSKKYLEKQKTMRLPHGSRFEMSWDAVNERWSGAMTVGNVSPSKILTAEATGVFRLLYDLDELYRQWVRDGMEK